MTQPKLTPAQQQVFDWLGGSRERWLLFMPELSPSWELYQRGGAEPAVRADVLYRVSAHLHTLFSRSSCTAYIHTKFAGGTDDTST